ncbi:hypothetical protein CVU37_03855 [candidate division BRC1 bacterium HGW-BRC1-1]|jgi:signal transduction histidine kinase|nr:MAG: hypothetical protein CVU37_03855 [candidate division BRC1 bacterium HGW-BRC1-1]
MSQPPANSGHIGFGEPAQARRVLVIDDEQRMADGIQSLLSAAGFAADTAYSGREGLRRLSDEDYQVVITDLHMEDLDGFEVIRTTGVRRNIAFIVITGHASTESAIRALRHQCFDYIIKPFDFEVLRNSVERAFEKIEAVRFRDDMISMITHDIKIPLSSIIGYSSLVFDKTTNEINPRAREFVQTINSNGVKILSLVDNFLTSCKIESGRLSIFPREVNINYLMEDLMCVFQVDIERNQLHLNTNMTPDLPMVMGDENLLFRALSNVLSNAVKFTPRDGTVNLRTAVAESAQTPLERTCVLIEVSNTGPGIAPEDLPRIFEKYHRSRAHRGIEGSGIGSYVLRYVVEAHGGRVLAESVPNELTTFRVFLPIGESSAQ